MSLFHLGVNSVLSQVLTIMYVLLISHAPLLTSARRRGPRYQKLCKDSHIQIMSRRGVKIEPYERSRVELLLADYTRDIYRNKLRVHFQFKTSSENGTLFYGLPNSHDNELIALTLRNGRPRYKIQCPTGVVDVPVPTPKNKPVNDGRWHTVQFDTRYGHHGDISLDGISLRKRYVFGCHDISMLVMGGHNPDLNHSNFLPELTLHERFEAGQRVVSWSENHKWLAGTDGHFEGCIRRLNLHHYLHSPPKYYAVSECD